ncbi:hypothetical protein ACHAXR_007326, partial [Thalassiosira sp. AJA248-18]
HCEAFLLRAPSSIISTNKKSNSRLHGIQEWREQALESKYTLDSYQQIQQSNKSPASPESPVPALLPILPFPFSDILVQGQTKQLNLYEKRFHDLFTDAVENHCGMVGMGLLAGNGMITTLPLCEVESFTRFGAEDDWVDRGDGMGNGSIFVTIRAVGRAKIVESDLMQEEPYMKARVAEIMDEDISLLYGGIKERGERKLSGESSPMSVASSVAGNIENLMVSLASMEHKLNEIEEEKKKEDDNEVMNRRLVNAQLESLFMKDSSEGVDVATTAEADVDDKYDDNLDDEEDDIPDDENDEHLDRLAQFRKAFESAKETDTFGYVMTKADDNLAESKKESLRTPKDLTAISWAAFCTGKTDDIKRDVVKIQALDMTNVMQRLQLASAMLREEKKVWTAKLALAGIKNIIDEEE